MIIQEIIRHCCRVYFNPSTHYCSVINDKTLRHNTVKTLGRQEFNLFYIIILTIWIILLREDTQAIKATHDIFVISVYKSCTLFELRLRVNCVEAI